MLGFTPGKSHTQSKVHCKNIFLEGIHTRQLKFIAKLESYIINPA